MEVDPAEEMRKSIEDMEASIQSHPEETSSLYFQYRDEVRSRATSILKQGISEGTLSQMNEEDVGLASAFVAPASFIMAWYGANHKREKQKKASFAYSGVLSLVTRTPLDASALFLLQAEKAWMSVLPKKHAGCSASALIFLALGATVAQIAFGF